MLFKLTYYLVNARKVNRKKNQNNKRTIILLLESECC